MRGQATWIDDRWRRDREVPWVWERGRVFEGRRGAWLLIGASGSRRILLTPPDRYAYFAFGRARRFLAPGTQPTRHSAPQRLPSRTCTMIGHPIGWLSAPAAKVKNLINGG